MNMNPITPDPDAIGTEFPEHAQATPDAMPDDTQETLDTDDDDAEFEDDDDSDEDADAEEEVEED
jgi:hypothetical protein